MTLATPITIQNDSQRFLVAIRKIVKALRQASKMTESTAGLSAAQLFVLQKVANSEKPLSINELAARTLTHQSSVSVVVNKLVKKSLIKRQTSTLDARIAEVLLTKKGAAVLEKTPHLIQDQILNGLSNLSPEVRKGLVIGLEALIEKSGLSDEDPTLFFEDDKDAGSKKR